MCEYLTKLNVYIKRKRGDTNAPDIVFFLISFNKVFVCVCVCVCVEQIKGRNIKWNIKNKFWKYYNNNKKESTHIHREG